MLISVAQLMVVLDATIANIALPFIKEDLGISPANLSWVVTGYALAFGGLLLLGGRLGDLYGRRRMFMVGVVVFAAASLLGGLAQSEGLLLGARGLQGLGAAIASPAALALITTTFPAGPQRNRAFSVYAAMSGAGAAVGLILGGWLTGLEPTFFGTVVDGWRLTFLINVPIGLLAALAAPRLLRESESRPGELDLPGALSGTLGLVGIVYGLTRAGDQRYGWGDPWTLVSLVVGVLLLVAFTVIERRVAHPLLPFRILANRTRATSFVVMMLVPAAMFAMFYFLSLFVQNVMGFSPLRTGVAFLPFSAGIVVAAVISSKLVERVDPRWLAGVGTAMAGAALFGFSKLPYDDRLGHLAVTAQLRHRHPAVHRADVAGHGADLRAAHADRRPRRRRPRLGHRLRDAQHHAAGRRRARPGHAEHGGRALHPGQGRPRSEPPPRRPPRRAVPPTRRSSRSSSSWSARSPSPRARPTRSSPAPG